MDGIDTWVEIGRQTPGDESIANGWSFVCWVAGCNSVAHIERPDGTPVSRERAEVIARLNGWRPESNKRGCKCPHHAEVA